MKSKKKILLFLFLIIILIIGFFFLSNIFKPTIEDPTLNKIKSSGVLVVGISFPYPPMIFLDERGNFSGIDADIIREVASDLGVEVKFKNFVWEGFFYALIEERVDVIISAITILPERAEFMLFSRPYFVSGQIIVVREELVDQIKGVSDLYNRIVGVQSKTTSEIEAYKHVNHNNILSFANYALARDALLEGKVEAIIIDYPAGINTVQKNENLRIIGTPFTKEFYGIAVRKNDHILLEEINKTIRRLQRESLLKKIENKWIIE